MAGFNRYPFVFVLFFLLLAPLDVFAQGKIAGRITDRQTGESLIGVNVVLDGTSQGAVTDGDGNYIIVNVRPGTYTLVFSYVGYQTQRIQGVRVSTGQTTRYDISMTETVIEGEEILVQAERPLIQKDLTASKKTVVAEDIDALPVESFFGVLVTQAGVNQGPSGEIHIRGGRSNEISYLVDGISVGDPFDTNGLATTVAADAIQEMTVISGAFNAEYGKAMSGIVNLVTKEGGTNFEGSFSLHGGDIFTSNDDIFFTPSTPSIDIYTLEGTLGGPLTFLPRGNFFISARHDVDDGYTYGIRRHAPDDSANFNVSPIYYEIQGRPWWEYLTPEQSDVGQGLPLPDERVPLHPSQASNFIGKLTFRPAQSIKVEYSFIYDYSKAKPLSGTSFLYRYNPDGLATNREDGFSHRLGYTHTLDNSTFYKLFVSYASNRFRRFLYEDPTNPLYVRDIDEIGEGTVVGFPGINFLMGGNQKTHLKEQSESIRAKLDFTKQFGVVHEAKFGVEAQLHSLDRRIFSVLFNDNVLYRDGPTVPDESTPAHDVYKDQRVLEVSAFAQDKLEFDNFIINAGIRYEYFDPNGEFIPNLLNPFEELQDADVKHLFLPRVGVSFPITTTGIIHFSYGHFAQMPPLRRLYLNPEFEFPVGNAPTYGNTNMRPERTVQYEIGLQQQIGEHLAFDVTGFFKDIRDYLALQRVRFSTVAGEDVYNIYLNKDYANVRGVTFALTRRRERNGLLSANIDYTFQVAEGNNDDPDAFFFNFLSGREDEFEIVPLDFDQRHILSSTVTLTKPGNWGASFIGQFSTGYPYTPLLIDQKIDQLPNSGRKPTQLKLDAHLYKEFNVGGTYLRVFAKVFNILDRLNERFVFDDTGRATYSLNGQRGVHEAWEPFYDLPGINDLDNYNTRPHFYSAPREIRVGVTLNF
ncbi:MAG: TonB-dependent receptor [Rhodothermaceae bacterium]|nr:TonB-dependent receptor [Rhodothermaceae bacterium]